MNKECLRCGNPITKRSGTKYCSNDCNKQDYYEKHRTEICARSRTYQANHPRERKNLYSRDLHMMIRSSVLLHYGWNCACCGEGRYEFLAIDHINGGGRKHEKERKISLDDWIVKNNFPEGFRILCHNCNMSLGNYKYCPHNEPQTISLPTTRS